MAKTYLVKDLNDPNVKKIETRSDRPSNAIVELPKALSEERAEDLDIITEEVEEFGEVRTVKRVELNEQRKAQRIARETQEREARLQREAQREQTRDNLIAKLKASNAQGPLKDLIDLILLERGE